VIIASAHAGLFTLAAPCSLIASLWVNPNLLLSLLGTEMEERSCHCNPLTSADYNSMIFATLGEFVGE
jgi:hypothetical protein